MNCPSTDRSPGRRDQWPSHGVGAEVLRGLDFKILLGRHVPGISCAHAMRIITIMCMYASAYYIYIYSKINICLYI